MKYLAGILLFLFFTSARLGAQNNFFEPDTIQLIEITFAQSNWDYMLDTAKAGTDDYVLATQVKINGTLFDSVGVRYKGNSSYDSTSGKNPLHIKLDYVHGNAAYHGYEDVKLGNEYSDPSMVREVLAYEILRNYMDAPESNFAQVYINGNYYGVFTSSESIDSEFLNDHFFSSGNSFFKCNPANVLNGQIPNLIYLGTDSVNYYNRYELKSDEAWKDIIDLCDTLVNFSAHIDSILDVDRALWMLAFNNVTVNLDSYTGSFAQNYYLYRDDNARFVPVVWDLNMCFGAFTNTGSGNLNLPGEQQMSPMLHSTNGARPLIMKLLADPTYQKMYIAHMRTITDEFFSDSAYYFRAQELQNVIDTAVQSEAAPLYTYSQFQQGISTNFGTVPGLTNLMEARNTYLQSTTQFTNVAPVITAVATSPAQVVLHDTIWITCTVTNPTSVLFGYRDQLANRFRRAAMYDDGLHHDGIAGDNVFSAPLLASSALLQYYIYAQNANAGIFSPVRAEHEFYSVSVAVPVALPGQIVINEFLAVNQTGATDENGANEDWIELYNNSPVALDVFGLYLTDDFSTPLKYAMPDVVMQPYSYLIVWADEDGTALPNVHCNFKLAAGGEQLMLSAANGTVIDSVTFGVQDPDISMGRCANATGPFIYFFPATFSAINACPAAVEEFNHELTVKVFPNPANDVLTIATNDATLFAVQVFSADGQLLRTDHFDNDKIILDVSDLAAGIYFYNAVDKNGATTYNGRFVVLH